MIDLIARNERFSSFFFWNWDMSVFRNGRVVDD